MSKAYLLAYLSYILFLISGVFIVNFEYISYIVQMI